MLVTEVHSGTTPPNWDMLMKLNHVVSALMLAAAPLGAQTVFTGFTQNPGCVAGGPNGCAQKIAPSGDALTARNAFFSSLSSSVSTQNFESIADGTTAPITLGFGFAGNATLTGAGNVEQEDLVNRVPFGRYATSGSRYFQLSVGGNASFAVQFSQQVAGFGFYGTDLGDVGGSVLVRLLSGSTLLNTLTVQPSLGAGFFPELNGGLRFWSVLFGANTFDRIEFQLTGNPDDEDAFAFDDMVVADASQVVVPPVNVVPEPSTYALMLTGIAGLAVVARRRRSA